jgi:hypothetical protein
MSFLPFPSFSSLFRRLLRARAAACSAAAFLGALGPLPAVDVPVLTTAPGFVSAPRLELPAQAVLGGLAYTPSGRLVTYETASGEVRAHNGASYDTLAHFPATPFGSFLVVTPEEDALIFGENSEGKIYRVPLSGSGAVLLDAIVYNYDLAFDPAGHGFVSALGADFDGFNRIILLDSDPATESRVVVAGLPGFSGPVTCDSEGNLYYGTADNQALNGQAILKFAKSRVEEALVGSPLGPQDADIVIDELAGLYGLRFAGDRFYFTDLGFSLGGGVLFSIDAVGSTEPEPVLSFQAPGTLVSASFLAFRAGSRPFQPGAGSHGGAFAVAFSNFDAINGVAEVEPQLYFVRGRVNDDDIVDLSDAVAVLGYLFGGGQDPQDIEAADINADQIVDLSDAIYLLDYLFRGGSPIPPPFPEPGPAP